MNLKVRAYLSKQSNDFIQFKIDFLLKESEGDPIKKLKLFGILFQVYLKYLMLKKEKFI